MIQSNSIILYRGAVMLGNSDYVLAVADMVFVEMVLGTMVDGVGLTVAVALVDLRAYLGDDYGSEVDFFLLEGLRGLFLLMEVLVRFAE